MNLTSLAELPLGFQETDDFITLIDNCLFTGFARLSEDQQEGLESLARAFSGTPFADELTASIEELFNSQFQSRSFQILAACRTSLQGALYDSLIDQCDTITSRQRADTVATEWQDSESPLLESCSQWLSEIAVTGLRQLDCEDIDPFQQTMENLREDKQFIRQSVLLCGFANELSNSSPIAAMLEPPIRRWADMWSKAILNSYKLEAKCSEQPFTGELFILGTDISQHSNFVQLTCHALLTGDENNAVTINLSAYKVDSISAENIWKLFSDYSTLTDALVNAKSINIKDMPGLQNGSLLWDERCTSKGSAYDLFEKEEDYNLCKFSKISAANRHPAQICEAFFLKGKVIENDGSFQLKTSEANIELLTKRFCTASPLDIKSVKKAKSIFGLLRFDNALWSFQPLAYYALVKKNDILMHNGAYALGIPGKKAKNDPVEILRERASRLLRK
jgi:hypothetical protein